MTFQRARSDEQRAVRRQAILDTAAAMLAERPVAEISLNELARRVGLAKSNVLRYFESREAVLLELLAAAVRDWLGAEATALPAAVDPAAPAVRRAAQVAGELAGSLAARPALCELVSAQAAVLERNVSPDVAARYKHGMLDAARSLAGLVRAALPELDEVAAFRFGGATLLAVGAVWPHAQPSAAMLAAYAADPELAAVQLDVSDTLAELLGVLLDGLLARAAR